MKTNSILIVSNENQLDIKNSVHSHINFDLNIHGIDLFYNIDQHINEVIKNYKEIEWLIYNLNLDNQNIEDMIMINSYLPYYLYNKYSNLKFIFISYGIVFGEDIWGKSESDLHQPISLHAKSHSLAELKGERSWVLRYDIFSESALDMLILQDKIYYGNVDEKYSYITKKSINKIIEGLIQNYKDIEPSTYHIIPKDTHTQFEIFNYICWKNNKNTYVERASSTKPINKTLKTNDIKSLNKLWEFAGYNQIPTFKMLFDEL